jgi:hypothetical protein
VSEHDRNGYVQMPGLRIICGAPDGKRWYDANQGQCRNSQWFAQEQAIRAIWMSDEQRTHQGN